jgi:methionyl-tRNA formyltransferase
MRPPELLRRVESWRPDVMIVAGWYHMVPKAWRKVAPAFGLHASLLPDYSGGAPLVWAIINGEKRTGISLFQMSDGVDDGPLLGQAATEIADDDTIATLYARIEDLGVELLRTRLPLLADGTATLQVQDESRRRRVPQRSPEDGAIEWQWPARRVYDFIRAQTKPYPGAFAACGQQRLTIWRANVALPRAGAQPGRALSAEGRVFVGCGMDTAIELLEVALDGAELPLPAATEILNNHAHV